MTKQAAFPASGAGAQGARGTGAQGAAARAATLGAGAQGAAVQGAASQVPATQSPAAQAGQAPGKRAGRRRPPRRLGGRKARLPERTGVSLLIVVVALLLASLTHGPVFGDASGYVAAAGGTLLGTGVALLAWRLRLGLGVTTLLTLLVYFLFGGALAVPSTAIGGIVPTTGTLRLLTELLARVWMDLLTVTTPASIFVGPAALPYLTALVCSVLAASAVLRLRRPQWAALPVLSLAVIGILWGSQRAPLAAVIGALSGVVMLGWLAWVGRQSARHTGVGTVRFTSGNSAYRGIFVRAGALLAAAVTVAVAGGLYLLHGSQRVVLRDYVEPPLDLSLYHSPIAPLRATNTDHADDVLFTVSGLPAGTPVRLAALDYYDGTVFQLSPTGSNVAFHRIGQSVERPAQAPPATTTARITIRSYRGNWVPGGGDLAGLRYTGDRADQLKFTSYYAAPLGTILTKEGLQEGDSYEVDLAPAVTLSDDILKGVAFAEFPYEDAGVPPVVAERAPTLLGSAGSAIEQVRAMERHFASNGYFANGVDYPSLPGHRASRITRLLEEELLVGDDDQYAPAMALLLRAQGIPARVVVGFVPAGTGEELEVKGADMRAWVEVNFSGAGWQPFFPTPPRDQVPPDEKPEIKPNPRPQVIQPPEAPEEPAELPPDVLEDDKEEPDTPELTVPWLQIAVGVGALAALLPLLLILLAKARRRSRRARRGDANEQTISAWEELLDRAADYGVAVPGGATRPAQAQLLADVFSGRIALKRSRAKKGGRNVGQEDAQAAQRATGGQAARALAAGGRAAEGRFPRKKGKQLPARPVAEVKPVPFRWVRGEQEAVVLAALLSDQAAFGDIEVSGEQRDRTWELVSDVEAQLRATPGTRTTLRAKLSTASLRRKNVAQEAARADARAQRKLERAQIKQESRRASRHAKDMARRAKAAELEARKAEAAAAKAKADLSATMPSGPKKE